MADDIGRALAAALAAAEDPGPAAAAPAAALAAAVERAAAAASPTELLALLEVAAHPALRVGTAPFHSAAAVLAAFRTALVWARVRSRGAGGKHDNPFAPRAD